MSFIIECTDRDFDVENITRCLVLPAQREYVGRLTTDSPADASTTFDGDVQLIKVEVGLNRLHVTRWDEGTSDRVGMPFSVDVADIRRVEFY